MAYRYAKRSFDLINSILALIILSPLFLIIAFGIKLSSEGPVFYVSERIGLDGKPFSMYKFRTMHIKREGEEESQYLVNTQRIFKFGSFLRKSKLDELPQLLNVFLSNMSVVGPRPYPQAITDRLYVGKYQVILSVKPGLSCFDSLYDYAHGELFVADDDMYRTEVLPVRTELAKMYIDKKSIRVDAGIILRTISLIWKITIRKQSDFEYSKYEKNAILLVKSEKVR